MIFGEIMRWSEGDGGRERAEIISRKVVTQTDAWWFKALFSVRLRYSEHMPVLFQEALQI